MLFGDLNIANLTNLGDLNGYSDVYTAILGQLLLPPIKGNSK